MTPDGGVTLPSKVQIAGTGGTNPPCGSPPALYGFQLTQPTRVTMWAEEMPGAYSYSLALDAPCNVGSATNCYLNGVADTRLLGPGWHHVAYSGGAPYGAFLKFESEPPPPTNTTCATAQPLVQGQTLSVPRAVDSQPRIYSFLHQSTSSATFQTHAEVSTDAGECGVVGARFVVRKVCDDPSSPNLASTGGVMCKYPTWYGAQLLWTDQDASGNQLTQPGTYYLIVTPDPGAKFSVRYSVSPP